MKKILSILLVFAYGCGGTPGTPASSNASAAADATNSTAPTVDVPGGTASASESLPEGQSSKAIAVDGTQTGTGQSWMLDVTETMADFLVKSAEGVFFKDDDGENSILNLIFSNAEIGDKRRTVPTIKGPTEVGNFSGAADFASFTGCASDGTFHIPSAGNPLSATTFIGKTASSSLSRCSTLCLTSVSPVRGTIWLSPQAFFALFTDGRTPPATFRMKLAVDESVSSASDSACAFTTCKKFVTKMFTSGGGSSHFASFPNKFDGTLYLNSSNEKQFKVATRMDFPSTQSAGPCGNMNGFSINVQSNGSEVAGKFNMLFGGVTATIANGGINNTTGKCATNGSTIANFVASYAIGACANSSGTLLTAAQCSIDNDPNNLLTDPSVSTVEADTAFPSDAPTTF